MARCLVIASILCASVIGCGGNATDSDNGSGGSSSGGTSSSGGSDASGGSGADSAGGAGGVTLPPTATACEYPADCIVRSASCCGSCGAPSRTDIIALSADYASTYANDVCGDVFGCPACAAQPDNTLLVTCEAGKCVVIDLLEHDSTACTEASECRVRTPECCECGGSTDEFSVIAVSTSATSSYSALVCDPRADCAMCEPVYPAVRVDCVSGHCQVVR